MKKILIGLIAVLVCSLVVFGTGAVGFDEPLEAPQRVITITTADGTVVTVPMGEAEEEGFGGTIYNRLISFDEGIAVDGTTVIDGSGNWDGAITGTTGTFSSTLGVTGAVTLSSTLAVTGATTLTATTTINNDLVVGSTTAITGTLAVTGATTLSSTLGVTGATTLSSTLSAGTTTVTGLVIGSTTAATGAATFSSTLGVTGDFAVNTNKFTVAASTGNTVVAGTLGVTGESNIDTLISGGDITQLTATQTAQTLTAAQLCDSSVIRWDSSGTSSTLTMPVATSVVADCLTANGDTKNLLFENYGGETITIASSTGITLVEQSGGDVVIQTTEWALLTVVRRSSTTLVVVVDSLQDAD